jgi:predicted enzyme involved in methoxymalonyl-ACP biosynthesis
LDQPRHAKGEIDMDKETVKARAKTLWDAMTKSEKAMVRFAMFPADKMAQVDAEGFNNHDMVCALMDCAKADGGMRA